MESGTEVIAESGALTLSEAAWAVARRRAAIVQPLADSSVVAQADVEIAAQELGLSARQIYRLVKVWRGSGGNIASLVAAPPSGGKGKSRLSGQVATIVVSSIEDNYLTRQKPSIQALVKEVRRLCRLAGLTPPAYNTVANRIRQIAPQIATRKREGGEAARRFQSAGGDVHEQQHLLSKCKSTTLRSILWLSNRQPASRLAARISRSRLTPTVAQSWAFALRLRRHLQHPSDCVWPMQQVTRWPGLNGLG